MKIMHYKKPRGDKIFACFSTLYYFQTQFLVKSFCSKGFIFFIEKLRRFFSDIFLIRFILLTYSIIENFA